MTQRLDGNTANPPLCQAVRLRRIIVVLELRKVRSIYAVAGRS
jgi:hypothetical protein